MRDNSDSAGAAAATETMTYYWAWVGATRGAYPVPVAVGDLGLVLDVRNSQSGLVSVAKSLCEWCLLSVLLSIIWRSPSPIPVKGCQQPPFHLPPSPHRQGQLPLSFPRYQVPHQGRTSPLNHPLPQPLGPSAPNPIPPSCTQQEIPSPPCKPWRKRRTRWFLPSYLTSPGKGGGGGDVPGRNRVANASGPPFFCSVV